MTVMFSKAKMLRPFLRYFQLLSPHYYTVIRSPSSAFQWSKMHDHEWPVNVIQDVLCWLWRHMRQRRQIGLFSVLYVPLSSYCQIRYVSKFTAASRGSPCDSTAFLFLRLDIFRLRSNWNWEELWRAMPVRFSAYTCMFRWYLRDVYRLDVPRVRCTWRCDSTV